MTRLNEHGEIRPEYNTWLSMKARCSNKNHIVYKYYGGRGIKVCKRWVYSFQNFFVDMGCKPTPAHTLERNNTNKNYSPDNCRWATAKEQANNRRTNIFVTYNGQTKSMADWADHFGINITILYGRYWRSGLKHFPYGCKKWYDQRKIKM